MLCASARAPRAPKPSAPNDITAPAPQLKLSGLTLASELGPLLRALEAAARASTRSRAPRAKASAPLSLYSVTTAAPDAMATHHSHDDEEHARVGNIRAAGRGLR